MAHIPLVPGLSEPVIWAITADTVDALDVADPDRDGIYETVDVGPFDGQYLRLASEDLVLVADALRRLADRIIDCTVDVREELLHDDELLCPWCTEVLLPGDDYCGHVSCARRAGVEAEYEARS